MKSAIKTIAIASAATILAVGILAFSSETERKRQIEMAKKNIAERKAQIEKQKAELEAQLKALKAELREIDKATESLEAIEPVAAEPTTEPVAEVPVVEEPKVPPVAKYAQHVEPDGEFSLENRYLHMTIRELKAIAKTKKLKKYGSMKKAELAKALADLG